MLFVHIGRLQFVHPIHFQNVKGLNIYILSLYTNIITNEILDSKNDEKIYSVMKSSFEKIKIKRNISSKSMIEHVF